MEELHTVLGLYTYTVMIRRTILEYSGTTQTVICVEQCVQGTLEQEHKYMYSCRQWEKQLPGIDNDSNWLRTKLIDKTVMITCTCTCSTSVDRLIKLV